MDPDFIFTYIEITVGNLISASQTSYCSFISRVCASLTENLLGLLAGYIRVLVVIEALMGNVT